jgi:zinc protease
VPLRLSFALLGILPLAATAALLAAPAGQASPGGSAPTTPPASHRAAAQDAAPATAGGFPYRVAETTLGNGLKVVVIPYDSPGTVAYYTLVRTGSRDEIEAGHSGFAHFFEHMMFRGTEKYSQDRYTEVLKSMGADSNAFTTDDFTLYHTVGPSSRLETIAEMEADRFQNLKYSEEAFRTESLAILGEYNKGASSPFQALEEKLHDVAFSRHTYKHTTIGFLADVKAMPAYYEYSRQFFARFYRPENCILVVVGDVVPQRVFDLATRYYAGWKTGYQAAAIPPEPPQHEPRSGHVDWPNPVQPILVVSYHIPAFSDRTVDSAALDVIAQLLFAESSPLYQDLVAEKQWVDLLQGSADTRRDSFLFSVIARAKSPALVPKVKAEIEHGIAELQAAPVDPRRLERTLSHIRNSFALRLDAPGNVAVAVASILALTGDVHSLDRAVEQYARITPADIQRLARTVFVASNQTTVTLSGPQPAAGSGKPQGGARHEESR